MSRAGRTLHEVQSHLDREGASDLLVELVIRSVHSPSIFVEVVELGIALLEGGNPIIQKSIFTKLMALDLSQSFFKVKFIYYSENELTKEKKQFQILCFTTFILFIIYFLIFIL